MKFLIVLIILTIITLSSPAILFVYEMFRETYRTPISLMNNYTDILGISWKKNNDISSKGLENHYKLGAKLRRYYISRNYFLRDQFNPSQFELYSLNTTEHIFTAYSHLLGLYPQPYGPILSTEQLQGGIPTIDTPITNEVYKELSYGHYQGALPYKSIVFPIKAYPHLSNIFNMYSTCSNFIQTIISPNNYTIEIINLMKIFNNLYSNSLIQSTGLSKASFDKWETIVLICDAIILDYNENKMIPNVNMAQIKADCDTILYHDLYNNLLKENTDERVVKITISNMVSMIINKFLSAKNNKNKLKYIMNASSYIDLGALLKYINIAFEAPLYYPSYEDSLIIQFTMNDYEFDQNDYEKYRISIFFGEKVLLETTFVDFINKAKEHLYSSNVIETLCDLMTTSSISNEQNLYYLIGIILLSLCVINLGIFQYYQILNKIKKKKKKPSLEGSEQINENGFFDVNNPQQERFNYPECDSQDVWIRQKNDTDENN